MAITVSKSFIDAYWHKQNEIAVEKARKGEQASFHKYIYRKETGKKDRPYIYVWLEDLIKNPVKSLLGVFGLTEDSINKQFESSKAKEDFGADKKTFAQHLLEYFSHRQQWDKRFSDKKNAEKMNKKVKMTVAAQTSVQGMETPKATDVQQELFGDSDTKQEWKANPYLMRRIWGMYSGKNAENQEKQDQAAKNVIQTKTENPVVAVQPETKEEKKIQQPEKPKKRTKMEMYDELAENISKLKASGIVPADQIEASNNLELVDVLTKVNKQIEETPAIYEGDHTAHLHYFSAGVDYYITEMSKDGSGDAYGYVYSGDPMSDEWGYINLKELAKETMQFRNGGLDGINIDYYFKPESVEKLTGQEEENETGSEELTFEGSENKPQTTEELKQRSYDFEKENDEGMTLDQLKEKLETVKKNKVEFGSYFTTDNEAGITSKLQSDAQFDGTIQAIQDQIDQLESEAEKHENRSNAMLGNDNAKKYGLTDQEMKDLYYMFNQHGNKGYINWNSFDSDMGNYISAGSKIQKKIMKEIAKEKGVKYTEIPLSDVHNAINEIYNDYREERYGKDNNAIGSDRISGADESVRSGDFNTDGSENGSSTGNGSDGNELTVSTDELGIGLGEPAIDGGLTGTGIGRLSKKAAKEIREQCRKILEKPDSQITAEDKAVLANYEGAGGLHEGNQTDAAVLSEFYTPRDVIKKVWELVDKYNPNQNKRVIEPSSGTGRFAEGRSEKFTLCELDETSARIAGLLHPDAEVKQGAFQKLFVKNNAVQKEYKGEKYDVAVGNPPYGEYSGLYKGMGEGKIHTRYEEYFIDRTLDTLKDNGIMAFVVPSGFLRNADSKAKQAIAAKGKLLEAWRLPKGTFSSTDVGTDIIVLRKEKGNLEDFNNNKYFTDNPDHVIGNETFDGNWGSAVINRPEGKSIEDCISMIDVNATEVDKKIAEITENVTIEVKKPVEKDYAVSKLEVGATIVDKDGNKGQVTYISNTGMIGYKMETGSMGRTSPENFEVDESAAEEHENRSQAMIGNDNAKKDVHAEPKKKQRMTKAKEGDLFTPSTGKNMTADEFNKKYSKNIPAADMKYWRVTDWEGKVDTTKLSEKEIEELSKNKDFIKVDGSYVNVVNYASGNIHEKLDQLEQLKAAAEITPEEYQERKALLDAVVPPSKSVFNFTVSPVANFAKTFRNEEGENLVQQFEAWAGFTSRGNIPSYVNCPISKSELEEGMTYKDIWEYIHAVPVKAEKTKNKDDKETAKMFAEQKKKDRREVAERVFNQWLRQLPEDQIKAIEDKWNGTFNTFVNPDYTKIPLFIEGMNENKGTKEFVMTKQQIKGVSQLCNKGNGILAYDVGVGKTVTGIVATVNQIQTGKAKKPLICVPKAVYKKWIKEIHQHFPNLQVNELSNFNDKDLGKFRDASGKINLPENALNICSYEALQKITFKEETLNGALMDDMLDSQSVYDYDENGNLVADTRSDKEKAEAKEKILKALGESAKAKDGAVFWEDLGIDHITVDELHNFKNIFCIPRNIGKSSRQTTELKKDVWGRVINPEDAAPTMSNEYSGIAGSKSSRGMKMFAITQLIQRQTNGRGFFGLSATPFNNSPVEIYNILSLCARNRLKDLGVYNLGDFMKEYAEMKPDWKVKANGDTVSAQVMKNFKNLGALQNLITEFIDKVDGEEAGVVRPRKRIHKPQLDLTPLQKQMLEVENMRMNGYFSQGKRDNTGDVLVAMNNMRMITLSPTLVDPKFYEDYESVIDNFNPPNAEDVVEESPKLTFVCDLAAKQYKDRPKEGQVIYMPRGIEQYDKVKKYLVDQGMPEDSIAFMDSDTSQDKKEVIMKDFNDPDGKIKIIIGSETIKEGVSLNGNSTTIYNTMLGWNPTETIQVEGRIWRQGNKQGITHVVYPLMNDSIDAMMYQKYDEKSSRLNALWSYKGDSLNVEDIDPEELKFQLIKDPKKRAKLKIQMDQADLKKKKRMLNASYDTLYEQISDHRDNMRTLENIQKDIDSAEILVQRQSEKVEQKKKSLAAAKKTKDPDLIKTAQDSYDAEKNQLDLEKSKFRMQNNNKKDLVNRNTSIENYWRKQGFEPDQAESRLQKISEDRQETEKQLGDIQSRETEFVELYKRQIAEEQAAMKHYSVKSTVDYYADKIGNDLRPMDKELQAELRAELEEKYPQLKKSVFYIKNGRFLVKTFVK